MYTKKERPGGIAGPLSFGMNWRVDILKVETIVRLLLCGLLIVFLNHIDRQIYNLHTEVSDLKATVEAHVTHEEGDGRLPGDDIEAEWPKLYTEEDVVTIAKMLYGEAVGVPVLIFDDGSKVSTKSQQAAVVWTVLNRYDAGYGSIQTIVENIGHYNGYSDDNPVDDELLDLVYDVLDRWNAEKHGETDVGRVLPTGYCWFHGDGTYNYFRNKYKGGSRWNWEMEDVYG